MSRGFKIGDIVKHFKVEITNDDPFAYYYKIIGIATHTETGDYLVIYESIGNLKRMYARPYNMFMSEVDHDKYPNIKQKYRFEKVED